MKVFSDLTNEFQIVDYSATHGQLLIRGMRNKNRSYNIDVLFKGVIHLLIPTSLKGLEISVFENNEKQNYLIDEYGFKINRDYRIFFLKNSGGKVYFINAMCFGIYHNTLDILQTSIGRYDMGSLGENVLWYAD